MSDLYQELAEQAKQEVKAKKSKKARISKATLVITENLTTGELQATHKFMKKDDATFNSLTEPQKTCEILMWARCNPEMYKTIVEGFIDANLLPLLPENIEDTQPQEE